MATAKKQLPHLVFGGELVDLERSEFVDLAKLDLVGVYPNYDSARALMRAARSGSLSSSG